ncbi:carboxy terminal-processing peptidase [Duganella aceris]|uniref:Tail-specific protease n=1 Tax=Duganella aceris TaxID=2703883 RepID=A0ABX0FKI9_9BURK|nr:carboxy terminal-processing peptidase [Duganella aceris]NGZ85090.1 tail-specific protease [Duganella aceris]
MKKSLMPALILAVSMHWSAAQGDALRPGVTLSPDASASAAAVWSTRILSRYHYRPMALDAAMSEKIMRRYFDALDPERLLFSQADVDLYLKSSPTLGEATSHGDLAVPFALYALYQQRFEARMDYARSMLKTDLDFSVDESVQLNREKEAWPDGEEGLHELWRKWVKNDWLRLRLAGKNDKAIRDTLLKRYDNYVTRIHKMDSEDVVQIFIDAYAVSVEPHTNYLGPRVAEAFDFNMRLSLEGIGCTLQTREDYTVIRNIVPGSPAARSGKLHIGDRIVGVGQGTSGPIAEIIGWRINDVVELVRGKKNSTVRLEVLPAQAGQDGKHILVPLVRNTISMAEQSAKKSIVESGEGAGKRRIGIISLPAFYQDFQARHNGDKNFKSASRDVAVLLAELKTAKVDSILMDLRNNGGGSLDEAVDLTGLFIDKGPVVQQRNADGSINVSSDTKPGMAWDGPMGVLINRGSASASEIFAAAIQDYGRGLILGTTSFGKGTVQTVIGLDRFGQGQKPRMGEVKMTIAQFFRVNGGTTQLKGVVPDIRLLPLADDETFGESSYDNALPWTTLKPLPFVPAGDLTPVVMTLDRQHLARTASDKAYRYLEEDLALQGKLRKANVISLNETVRRRERDEQVARLRSREKMAGEKYRTDDGLQGDERSLFVELAAEAAAKKTKDIVLNEAVHVLADEAALMVAQQPLLVDSARPIPRRGKAIEPPRQGR